MEKINLIKYLHEELGFHILAFESEVGDCIAGDIMSPEQDAEQFMKKTIGRAWHNDCNLELFQYIKYTNKSNPLHFAGLDVQQSKNKYFDSFLENHLSGLLKEAYRKWNLQVTDLLLQEGFFQRIKLRKGAQNLVEEGKRLLEQINQQNFPDKTISKVIKQTLDNRLAYFQASMEKGYSKLFSYRDELMAKNLEFLARDIYPDEKFIIWAHNMHIKKESHANRFSPYLSLVEHLSDSIKQESYVIGLYAKEGRMKDYNDREYPIKKINKKHLEWILSHSPYQNSFITTDRDWAQQKWRVYEGGGMPMSLIPAQQYDGIIYFKHVSPA